MPWVMGIARHKLVDHYRRVEREQRRLAPAWDSSAQLAAGAVAGDDGDEIVEVLRRLSHRSIGWCSCSSTTRNSRLSRSPRRSAGRWMPPTHC